VLEQIAGHPVPTLKPLAKDAKIEGAVTDPRAKVKDTKGILIAESVNPKLPPAKNRATGLSKLKQLTMGFSPVS
jgi:outer membrane protein